MASKHQVIKRLCLLHHASVNLFSDEDLLLNQLLKHVEVMEKTESCLEI